jgi:hypothetical protein
MAKRSARGATRMDDPRQSAAHVQGSHCTHQLDLTLQRAPLPHWQAWHTRAQRAQRALAHDEQQGQHSEALVHR